MTFSDEEALLGTAVVSNGKAVLSDRALDAGSDPVTATFAPTGGGAEVSSAPFPQTVNPADSTVTVVSSRPTAEYFQTGTVTVTVKPVAPATSKPTGIIELLVSGSVWNLSLDTMGKAKLPLSEISASFYPGTYSITATYAGDENYNSSSTPTAVAQTFVGISSTPVSTISRNVNGQIVFSPTSFRMSSANPVGCNVTITNSTAEGFALLYGIQGQWKALPFGGIGPGASRGVGVGAPHTTASFTVRGASNYMTIKCV
jgi:hypothetical protein